MTKSILVSLFLVLFTSSVFAKEYRCTSKNSTVRTHTYFNSTQPLLQNEVTILNPDGSRKWVTNEDLILPTKACGIDLNFKVDCKVTANHDIFSGYAFAFQCAQQNIRGEFVVDTAEDGSFKCNDEPPTQFENCIAQ
jgi:hypothetical protein